MNRPRQWTGALALAAALVLAAGCDPKPSGSADSTEQLNREQAEERLAKLLRNHVDIRSGVITRSGRLPIGQTPDLAASLPSIETFPLTARQVPRSGHCTVVEIYVSTEKSGSGDDSWMVGEADRFNKAQMRGDVVACAQVEIRKIASGTGYEVIAAGRERPQGYSPSNAIWTTMLGARGVEVEVIQPRTVRNVAGVVIKQEVLDEIDKAPGADSRIEKIIDAVAAGRMAMGYTNPYRSSTGLNWLVTTLMTAAQGDGSKIGTAEVTSVFAAFQQGVPFVAETTLQMRESVRKDGSLQAFVMESQTFDNVAELSSYRFIPFGVVHDNPLVAIGPLEEQERGALEAFGEHLVGADAQERARAMGFGPKPAHVSAYTMPHGSQLVRAQQLWKEHKDGGKTIAAVFVADSSGSMAGARIEALKRGLRQASGFIGDNNEVGLVEFDSAVTVRRPIRPMGEGNTRGLLLGAVDTLEADGGTALYNAVLVGVNEVWERVKNDPTTRGQVIVLSDGESTDGLGLRAIAPVIAALKIPVITIAYGQDVGTDELKALSAIAEAPTIQVGSETVEHRLAHLFNAQL